jgi:transcriptional regulator of arginine metabolism
MPKTTTNDRTRRRRRLLELLSAGLEATQEEIVDKLAAEGFTATQATISRDLDDIGAVRRHDNGRAVYGLPERNGPPAGFGKRVFAELVREVTPSANLVVVRTFPGMASGVAAVLDQSDVQGILGTIAGDDTVLVIADEQSGGKRVAKAISELGATS